VGHRRVRASTSGLTIDPNNPDLLNVAVGTSSVAGLPSVQFSSDGGQTGSSVGTARIGPVHDLARTPDGSALFAATNAGVWRYLTSKQSVDARRPPCGRKKGGVRAPHLSAAKRAAARGA
jgi:hypothetical protein